MPLSFGRLQTVLQAYDEDEGEERSARTSDKAATDADWQKLRHVLLGRPILATLFRSPISQSQTTLVQWTSLPKPIQQKVLERHPRCLNVKDDTNRPDRTVEIPKFYLEEASEYDVSEAPQFQQVHGHSRLNGNLRDKLTEYTRGLTGQARPFQPGGGVKEELHDKMEGEDPYRTPSVLERHRKVLDQWPSDQDNGINVVEQLWKDGLLLSAPPGVEFKVGLSFENLEPKGTGSMMPAGTSDENQQQSSFLSEPYSSSKVVVGSSSSAPATNAQYTNATYFVENEIDSLFGGSSDGTASIYEENDVDLEDDSPRDMKKEDNDKISIQLDLSELSNEHEIPSTKNDDGQDNDGEEVDIDVLLSELKISAMPRDKQKSAAVAKSNNPLTIAERQARDQQDSTRKSWAITKPLPIDDFDTFLPNPALKYPFTLDTFQQQAIGRLERSENVFVAAHTSAGKTVVAEYAVALALQRATRCVYTSPIKALSNQKFRDFALKFGAKNVGLITGDLQVNAADSTCLIMTTEILRSMLYRGADLIRDIEYVIFDEVHYINDTERGVVWEEVIIMLPAHVTLVFLSATTPNTLEFSDWIGRTKRKPVHVIKTDYRPVPLSYNLWAGNDLHLVIQGKSGFLEQGYRDAANALLPAAAKDPKKKDDPKKNKKPSSGSRAMVWQGQGDKSNWISLVHYLDRFVMTPTVIFSFSKKKCEEIARMLQSIDLNTAKERSAVQGFTIQAISRLSQSDSKLPQVQMICEMVQRGIGVHHGGLLPILKETVEILFSRNLIKILLATETFAMGVNMPAKAVVFASIRKHDGTQFRNLEPGEMTQMAGRAGRRGLDEVGTVIICCFGEEPPPESMLRQMLTGSSTSLRSQFRLTYNMILNLLRVEEMSVESMIKRSFSEFATQRALTANNFPKLLAKGCRTIAKLEKQLADEVSMRVGAEDLEDYYQCSKSLLSTHRELLNFIRESDLSLFRDLFVIGRVLLVTAARAQGVVREPAIVLKLSDDEKQQSFGAAKKTTKSGLVCLMLLPLSYKPHENDEKMKPGTIGSVGSFDGRYYTIREIHPGQILLIFNRKVKVDPRDILKEEGPGRSGGGSLLGRPGADMFAGMKAVGKRDNNDTFLLSRLSPQESAVDKLVCILREVEEKELVGNIQSSVDLKTFFQRGPDVLRLREACQHVEYLSAELRSYKCHIHPSIEKYYLNIERKDMLQEKVIALQHFLSNESLALFPDFLQRKLVLQKLGYLNKNDTVYFKGRVACEINTCEELIATEMVFEGVLDDLNPAEIAAALSALVFQEKSESDLDSDLPETLVECCEKMKTIATNLGQVQKECGLLIDPAEYCDGSLKFGLVHVVFEWALGVTFKDICQLTHVQEGSIVRCITRLDELCREIRNCARVVGNATLYRKLEAASEAIKRDIVFASSLYVS